MPFDTPCHRQPSKGARQSRGTLAYLSGLAGEDAVCANYVSRGYRLCETRWRGRAGEIDLIFEQADCFVFVEVKTSRSLARAAASLSARQFERICTSAQDYISRTPQGQLADMRIDIAFVDGLGAIEILENASNL
jgi:putative endonuclease